MSLAHLTDNKKRIDLIDEVQKLKDKSQSLADELLKEIESADKQNEKQKQKKKEKKQKNKIQKAAEKQGLTVEELERQIILQEEQRKKEE